MYPNSPELTRLIVLRGFFTPNAVVMINACECGQNQELIRKTAAILGVTVIAYTGDTNVYDWGFIEGVDPSGNKVICTATGCREIPTMMEKLRQTFEKGPGRLGQPREMTLTRLHLRADGPAGRFSTISAVRWR